MHKIKDVDDDLCPACGHTLAIHTNNINCCLEVACNCSQYSEVAVTNLPHIKRCLEWLFLNIYPWDEP